MSVMTHLWVSPRGRHTTVSNHTAWVAKLFGTTLPDVADPEYQPEENKLYDMAYRANLMRVLADHERHTLYVDNLVTGDHYRWIAREGGRGNYLVLDTDGKEIANFQPGKRKRLKEAQLVQRVKLSMGVQAYLREALDIKSFILKQPIFHIFQSGDRWAVSVRQPVPKDADALSRKMKEWNLILAYIKPSGTSEDGLSAAGWELAAITDGKVLRHLPMTMWDVLWPTKEAAAEDIWKAYSKVQQESAPESVKNWIMNLKGPPARETEYRVFTVRNDGSVWWYKAHPLSTGRLYAKSRTGFDTLEDALRFANHENIISVPDSFVAKTHIPSGLKLMQWKITTNGGLLPVSTRDIGEAEEPMDHKKEMLRLLVPEETLASLGYKEGKHEGYSVWLKGPIPLARPLYTEQERDTGRVDKFTWTGATLRCDVGDRGWYVGMILNGTLEGSPHPQTHEMFMADVRAPMHKNRSEEWRMRDAEWPIYGGYDFASPLILATKAIEALIPSIGDAELFWKRRMELLHDVEAELRSKLPDVYKEAIDPVDPKKFIMSQPPLYFQRDENFADRIVVYLRSTYQIRDVGDAAQRREYGRGIVYLREGPQGLYLESLLGNGGAIKQHLRTALFAAKWPSQEKAASDIWDALKASGLEEAIDPRQFIMQNPGELLIYVNEYVVNTRDDKETRPLRVWIGSEFQNEASARRTAVNVARLAVENPNREIVRVEMEIWDVPATYDAGEAKLLHTYLVKTDGTFEEIPGPADPTRAVVGGGGN